MTGKEKIQLEFVIKSSPSLLFERISTASGLGAWFADDVSIRGDLFTFTWNEYPQEAKLLYKRNNTSARFKWLEEEEEDTYFEFKISQDELTGDVSLIVTDFVDPEEKKETISLWETQIGNLKHLIGS